MEKDSISADELATFSDGESDERAHWKRVESEALRLCDPLARMLVHKTITGPLDMANSQITRELSDHYDNRLSLSLALYILRKTQHPELARVIICEGAGYRLPEPQKPKVTDSEYRRAFEAECNDAGPMGQLLMERARRRARAGR